MFGWLRVIKFCSTILAASALLACLSTPLLAATGSVRLIITRTNFIFGGGSGTLHLHGKRYELRVGGISIGPFGAPRADLVGRAYSLRSAASIHGIYSVVTTGGTGRPGTVRLQNWQGVILELRGRQGVNPSFDLSGLDITLR